MIRDELLALCGTLLLGAASIADEVVLKNGSSFSGTIEREDDQQVTIRMECGSMTFDRSQVARIRRDGATQDPAPPPSTGRTGEDRQPSSETTDAGKGSTPVADPGAGSDEVLARVGPGAVTRDAYKGYLARERYEHGDSPEARREALRKAIDDELLYQGALEDRVYEREPVQGLLVREINDRHSKSLADLPRPTEEEKRAYYDGHAPEFAQAESIRLQWVCFFRRTSEEELEAALDQIEKGTFPQDRWKDFGKAWYELRPSRHPVWEELRTRFFRTFQPGEVSVPILNDITGQVDVFRIAERRGSRTAPFEEVEPEIRAILEKERRLAVQAAQREELDREGADLTDREKEVRAAVRLGLHLSPNVRGAMVDAYVASMGVTREAILQALRERFAVEILVEEE